MRSAAVLIAGFLMSLAPGLAAMGPGMDGAAATAPESSHDFGQVLQGAVVEHTFALRNDTSSPLRISGVQLTPHLQLARTPARIAPAETGRLVVRLDTTRVEGGFEGGLLVQVAGEPAPRAFELRGRVVPEIEVSPRPAFFLSTVAGEEKSASLDLQNNGTRPIRLSLPVVSDPRFRLGLEEIEAGERYRLEATLPADAAPGQFTTRLELRRSDGRVLPIGMNGRVRARVSTFPDTVDFGRLAPADLSNPAVATQNLMVYQHGGTAFEVRASSDIPGLKLQVEPGAGHDRVQVVASLAPGMHPGDLHGSIVLATSDPEFRELRVPVTGEILHATPTQPAGGQEFQH